MKMKTEKTEEVLAGTGRGINMASITNKPIKQTIIIEIELKDNRFCEGCPCIDNEYQDCNYFDKHLTWIYRHKDYQGYAGYIRLKECRKRFGYKNDKKN